MLILIPDDAKNFMAYNYAELKDLCKQFLTLASGILVFSITFADKIGGHKTAPRWSLMISWCAFILAIALCGLGLGFMAFAGKQAVAGAATGIYRNLEYRATRMAIAAAFTFLIGLVALVISGVLAMFKKQRSITNWD